MGTWGESVFIRCSITTFQIFQPKMKILSVLFAFCLVAVHCLPMENKNETRTLIPALELAHPTCNETTPCNDPNHFCGKIGGTYQLVFRLSMLFEENSWMALQQ